MVTTPFTLQAGLQHPIILAPMGGVAGGRLAAAVSNAGGLGLIGAGYGDSQWLQHELAQFKEHADEGKPWGVGFITWSIQPGALDQVLAAQPDFCMLSFGNPAPYAEKIRAAGCRLICQVQDLAGAQQALEAGADILVAQGTEGGGHGGQRATLPLVPAIVDLNPAVPVVAAGGIADGRGLAAALMLGAQAVLMGTRFYASSEALGHTAAKAAITAASGDATRRTSVFDIVRGYHWPQGHTGRALLNQFLDTWQGREHELAQSVQQESARFWAAADQGDVDTAMVWAGEVVDLIKRIEPAAAIIDRIVQQAQHQLQKASEFLD